MSLSGTVTSQTYSLTINSKSLAYTSSGSDTVATILTALVALWNQLTPTNPPEFKELTAVGLPVGGPFTSMTLTGNTAGKPSTITVSTSGAATFSRTNTSPATGPNFFDNALNWSGGVAPVNSDTLVFDNGAIPCKYNLSTTLTGIVLNVNPAYSGTIGLPIINSDANTTYAEYRPTSLTLAGGTAVINSGLVGRCNLAFGANAATVRVLQTGQRSDQNTPVVLLSGGNGSSELDVSKGDVATSFYAGVTSTWPIVNLGFTTNPAADTTFFAGTSATLTTITKNGGTAKIQSSATTVTQDIQGGTLTIAESAAITTLSAYAGTVQISTVGTIGTINLYGSATLTCDTDTRSKVFTNSINIYSPLVTVIDSAKTVNSGVLSLAMNGNPSVNFNHGGNSSLVIT